MWSIQDVSAEELARLLHHYRGALSHDFHDPNQDENTSAWDRTPQNERKLMIAAARLALMELATAPAEAPRRPYFAKPAKRTGVANPLCDKFGGEMLLEQISEFKPRFFSG